MGQAASCSGGGLSKSGVAEKIMYHLPEMLWISGAFAVSAAHPGLESSHTETAGQTRSTAREMTNPKISGPRLATVLAAAVRAKDNPGLLVIPIVCQGLGAPESDVVVGAVSEQIPFFTVGGVPRHLDIQGQSSVILVPGSEGWETRDGHPRWTPAMDTRAALGLSHTPRVPVGGGPGTYTSLILTLIHTESGGQPTVGVAHVRGKDGVAVCCVCLQQCATRQQGLMDRTRCYQFG